MRTYCLGLLTVSSLAAIVASEPAAAYTQLCSGAALAGVTGPITNGSTCNLEATGNTVKEVFVGVGASDRDFLDFGSTPIFNNQTATTLPVTTASQSVAKGSTLNYNLVNTTDPLSILIGGPPTFSTPKRRPPPPPFRFPPLSTNRRCLGFTTSLGSTWLTRPTSIVYLAPKSPCRLASTPIFWATADTRIGHSSAWRIRGSPRTTIGTTPSMRSRELRRSARSCRRPQFPSRRHG